MSKAPLWIEPAPGARKPRFTREQIAEVALAIADRDGFGALSMRRIAEELGAGTMTLYWYIRTKDDLMALMDDALMGEVVARAHRLPAGWRPALARIARATRDTFVRHPWALHSFQGNRLGPNNLRHIEQSLAAIADAPVDTPTKLEILSIVDDYVFGHVMRVGTAAEPAPDASTVRAINELTLAQLATGTYPQLRALIGDDTPMVAFTRFARHMTGDERFDLGLEALLDGLEARIARASPARRGGRARGRRRTRRGAA